MTPFRTPRAAPAPVPDPARRAGPRRRRLLLVGLALAALVGGGAAAAPAAPAHAAGPSAIGSSIDAMPAFPTPTSVIPATGSPIVIPAGQTRDFHFALINGRTTGPNEFQQPVVVLEPGATIKNAVVGLEAADGLHCLASCTIDDVYFQHVGEDAITLVEGSPASSVVTIHGGGAKYAYDKVVQVDGAGDVDISHYAVSHIGTLLRACGTCPSQHRHRFDIRDVYIEDGSYKVVGVNQDQGDRAHLQDLTIAGKHLQICWRSNTVPGGGPAVKIPGKGEPFPGVCDFSYGTIRYLD